MPRSGSETVTEMQSASSKRRRRWWGVLGLVFGIAAALVLAVSIAVYVERMRVATLIVQGGFLVRVRAGPVDAPDFTAEGADVTLIYPDTGLVGRVTPQVASVRLIRPFLHATYDGDKLSFGSLQALVDDALNADSNAPKPAVTIQNGDLLLATPNGTLNLMADATLANGRLEHLKATVQRGTFRGSNFAGEVAAGTVAADFVGDALNASATLNFDSVTFEGRSARGIELASEIRGLKWQGEGPSYNFVLASVVVTLNAAALDAPEATAGASTSHLALETVEGNFADGQIRAAGHGDVNAQLTQLHAGDATMTSFKTQASLSSWTLTFSKDSWSVDETARFVADGSDVKYPALGGVVALNSFKADFESSGTLKAHGASGTLRGTLSANGNLPRAIALRSLQAQFDGTGTFAKDNAEGTLQVTLTATGNVPRALALDLAHRVPGIGGDEALASSLAGALQSATVRAQDIRLVRSRESTTLSTRGPVTLAGVQQASFSLTPHTARPLVEMRGGEMAGAFDLNIRGGGLPELRLAVASYRYRQQANRSMLDAETQFETSLDFGSFRGLHLSGGGKLQLAGDRMNFAAADCSDLSLASFRNNGVDQIRNLKSRLCGSALQIAGDRMQFTLPGCADFSFDSLLNNGTAVVSDAKGKLCGTMARPVFVSNPAGWQLEGRWSDSSARIESAESGLADANGRVQLSGSGAEIKSGNVNLDSARLTDLTPEPRFQPLTASGAMRATGANWQGQFNLAATNRPLATVALKHSLDTGTGEAAIEARELAFEPNGLQPAQIAPFLSSFGTRVRGRAAFSGLVAWSKDGLTSNGRLNISGIDFQSRFGMVRQLNADLALSSLSPFALAPNQTVTVNRVELFVPLEQVSARFTYTPEALRLETATANAAEGRVALDPLTYSFAPGATTSGTLRLQNLNVTPLIAAAGLADRMNATARIDGIVPFTVGPQGIRFVNGHIAANGPGRLSIKRESLTTSVGTGGGTQAPPNAVQDFAYQALENLAFEQLDGTVNSLPMGRMGLLLHIKGRNDPPVQVAETRVGVVALLRGRAFDKPLPLPKGTPIDLTLDTSLNLDELLNSYFNRVGGNGAAAEEASK